jgi:hypothetical protein
MIRRTVSHCASLITIGPVILRQTGTMRQAGTIEMLLRGDTITLSQSDVFDLLPGLRRFAEWGSLA